LKVFKTYLIVRYNIVFDIETKFNIVIEIILYFVIVFTNKISIYCYKYNIGLLYDKTARTWLHRHIESQERRSPIGETCIIRVKIVLDSSHPAKYYYRKVNFDTYVFIFSSLIQVYIFYKDDVSYLLYFFSH